ncbi:MAG: hypothetical protein LUQ50_13530 [Methanospirillum sp.]|uniref:hypothetical protein n=1 Tax=Methanospirillum sp. TaxID=45200 RepID=UPI002371A2DD|nr:hypothetical protein [Methanospirillum sp.]MDD1730077.1 hypothetical protein [Methanospirillum sp.]
MPGEIGLAGVLAGIRLLVPEGHVFEIRTLGPDGIGSGYYNNPEKAADDVLLLEQDLRISGIYLTLNDVNPVLLARRSNRIKTRLTRSEATTADCDIVRRRWLPIDIDPIRISGVSSSDSEHESALSLSKTISSWLSDNGWPDPIISDSGNGAHLLYAIDLPNDDASRDLVRSLLEFLDNRFSTSVCKVDTANYNASRIWKVYGTYARKGDNVSDRPHRRSQIIASPQAPVIVSPGQMHLLVAEFSSPDSSALSGITGDPTRDERSGEGEPKSECSTRLRNGSRSGSGFDLGSWLNVHHLTATAKPYRGGTLYSLDRCPFSDEHTDGAFAIQFPNGAIFAGCHHDSCGSGRQRWPELRARFDGSDPARARSAGLRSGRGGEHNPSEQINGPPSSGSCARTGAGIAGKSMGTDRDKEHEEDPLLIRAREILARENPLETMLETFGRYHEGDQTVAEYLVHSLASRTVINSRGLHVSITGESGKGKSHAIETMKSLIPAAYRLDGRMSDKALFYMDDLIPGTVITLDDVNLSDQMQEILKGVTTSFQKPFPYRTVNTERKPQICTIPERCVWWIAKVEGAGDDQVFNRMLTCWIDDSDEQDQKVLDRTLAGAEQLPESSVQVSEDIAVCKTIWNELKEVFVVIPFARRIRFQSAENRRNPDMLLDLIRTNAVLCQQQRTMIESGGVSCVTATEEDFNQAARLFVALNGETGGQASKLTRRESALIEAIASAEVPEITTEELQQVTGWTNSSISKLIHGYRSHGKSYSGILEKCPAISFLDRTISVGDEGCTTMRRTRAYHWDSGLYNAWVKGGSVWLADEPSSGDDHDPDPGHDSLPEPPSDPASVSEVPESPVTSDESSISELSTGEEADGAGRVEDASGVSLSSIRPQDFVRVTSGPDKRRCSVCGKRKTRFQEKESKRRGEPGNHHSLTLCRSCYDRAVSRVVASHVVLPGTVDTTQMVKRSTPSGRCCLCNLQPAIWIDPSSRTGLCEACYNRCAQSERFRSSDKDSPP